MSRITTFNGYHNPIIQWKSSTPVSKTGFVSSNAPTNIKPLTDSENRSAPFGHPKPLQIYRRGRNSRNVASSKLTLRESLENPGTYITNNNKTEAELCNDCNGGALVNNYGNKVNLSENPLTPSQCYSQANFGRRRNRATKFKLQKGYHTRHEELRKSRGAVNKANLYYSKCGDDVCQDVDTPTNHKYHVNGAVSSSARLDRLKLDAVESTKIRYVGDYKEPYNQKSKTDFSNCKSYGVPCK